MIGGLGMGVQPHRPNACQGGPALIRLRKWRNAKATMPRDGGPSRAQALVELALVLPSALLIFVLVVDLGRAFNAAIAIHDAVQAGAMVAKDWQHRSDRGNGSPPCGTLSGVACANRQVCSAIQNATLGSVAIFDADIALSPAAEWGNGDCNSGSDTGWTPGGSFTITVQHVFRFITPVLQNLLSPRLSASVTGCRNGPIPPSPPCP